MDRIFIRNSSFLAVGIPEFFGVDLLDSSAVFVTRLLNLRIESGIIFGKLTVTLKSFFHLCSLEIWNHSEMTWRSSCFEK